MKKLLSLVALAGMVLGAAGMASAATDVKVKGKFDFGFGLYKGTTFIKDDGQENFDALQRFRTQVDFIASESLKGVAYFEIGNTHWGNGGGATYGWGDAAGRSAGGAMGADGVAVEVKNLYIDWLAPETDLQIRMGIQGFALPTAVMRADMNNGNAIIDDDLAGILLSYNFTEEVGATLGWFRPWNPYIYGQAEVTEPITQHDAIDLFTFTLPIEFKDSFSLTPWFMYGSIGQVDDNGVDWAATDRGAGTIGNWLSATGGLGGLAGASDLGANGNAWWTGFAFNLSAFDPFFAALDFMYGSYSADDISTALGSVNPDRSGWAVVAKMGYKLDYFTPAIFGWYGSGSSNLGKDGLDGMLPVLSPYFGQTSFGGVYNHFGARNSLISASPAGTWAIGLELGDIKFIDNLTSILRVAYFRGTNDRGDLPKGIAFPLSSALGLAQGIMTADDSAIEVNLDNVYNIYENLDLFVELGYINMDVADAPDAFQRNAWKGYVGFSYSF